MFELKFHKDVTKNLLKLSLNKRKKVVEKITKIKTSPFSPSLPVKKMVGSQKMWRMRIGNLRLIYKVDDENKIIYLKKLGFRGDIYK